jgi:CheY-like chemotaxis protein
VKVLLVDDDRDFAGLIGSRLHEQFGLDVSGAGDPVEARTRLGAEAFDVVVVDMRYRDLADAFERRWRGRQISIMDDTTFLISGLATIHDVAALGRRPGDEGRQPGVVLWSSFEANRVLQMVYAHEVLHTRVFCFKGSGGARPGGSITALVEAIRRAEHGLAHADPKASLYLPAPGTPRLVDSLFAKPSWCSIWRALATGISNRLDVTSATLNSRSVVNNGLVDMNRALQLFDPGLPNRDPLPQLIAYASSNWEFFLDDTVMRAHPPREARGLRVNHGG